MDKTEARAVSDAIASIVRARLELPEADKARSQYFTAEAEAAADARTLAPGNPRAAERQARDGEALAAALDPVRRKEVLQEIDTISQQSDPQPLPRVERTQYSDVSTPALRATSAALDNRAGSDQARVIDQVETEMLRRQVEVAKGERRGIELVTPATDKDREDSNAAIRGAGITPRELQRTTAIATLEAAVRVELETEYAQKFGTSVGAKTFAANVVDRVYERIEQDPSLASVRDELRTGKTAKTDSNKTDGPEIPLRRDPVLQRETTETLVAAEVIATAREQRDPSEDNRVKAALLEQEIGFRRTQSIVADERSPSTVRDRIQSQDYQNGAELLSRVDRDGAKAKTGGESVREESNER